MFLPNDQSVGEEHLVSLWNRTDRKVHDAVALCGIVSREGRPAPNIPADAQMIDYRDVSAIVRNADFIRTEPTEAGILAYREVVEGAFACGAVIPAPYGTIFRNHDALLRWLELHYFTLADALRYLHDRQVARVRVAPAALGSQWDTVEYRTRGADLDVTAFESFRVLKRQAVAYVPIEVAGPPRRSGRRGRVPGRSRSLEPVHGVAEGRAAPPARPAVRAHGPVAGVRFREAGSEWLNET